MFDGKIDTFESYRGFRLIPPGHRKSSKFWIARGKVDDLHTEFSTGAEDIESAQVMIDRLFVQLQHERAKQASCGVDTRRGTRECPPWASKLRRAARQRALDSAIPFSLTREQMGSIVARANGRCEVSGLDFVITPGGAGVRNPYAPSLDRIVPANGYTAANCRLVLFAVNVAMSDWGVEVLRRIAIAIGQKQDL